MLLCGGDPDLLGAPEITDYVPENCFIDKRRFPAYEDLRAFLKSLTETEIQGYRENARDYLASEKYNPFKREAFTDLFRTIVEEDSGIRFAG